MERSVFTILIQAWCLLIIASTLVLGQDTRFKYVMSNVSQVYNCSLTFVEETQSIVCDGLNSTIAYDIFYHLEFKLLGDNASNSRNALGLHNLSVSYMDKYRRDLRKLAYTVDFNSSLQVAYLDGIEDCKSGRFCIVWMGDAFLELPIFNKEFWPWGLSSLWNFSSPLFDVERRWLQGLSIENGQLYTVLSSLTSLQHTSIQSLNISGLGSVNVINLQNMPLLKTVHLDSYNNLLFHHECFLGTPKVESLTIKAYQTKKIPSLLTRIPNLRHLKFSNLKYTEHVDIASEQLSALHNLESLSLENMAVEPISFKLPKLPTLKKLALSNCQISTLAENDFVNFPSLEDLDLSRNKLPSLKKETLINLRRLKVLNLSRNKLLNWPVLYQSSLKIVDLSQNALETVENLGKTGTTVEFLNISGNKIAWWNDEEVFSQDGFGSSSPLVFPYTHPDSKETQDSDGDYDDVSLVESLTDEDKAGLCSLLLSKFPLHYETEDTSLGSPATPFNYTETERSSILLKQLQRLKNLVQLGSSAKPFNYSIPEINSSLVKALDCSKHSEALEVSATTEAEYNDEFDGTLWVKSIDLSNNNLFDGLSEVMIRSLTGLEHLDLGGNPFNCDSCALLPFQKWLNSSSTKITNFGIPAPLRCAFPPSEEGFRIAEIHFDPCPKEGLSVGAIGGIVAGILLLIICIICGMVVYRRRSRHPTSDGFSQF